MRILVVGLGSIARRHVRNLARIAPDAKIGVWRQRSRDDDLGDLGPLVDRIFFSADQALAWKPTAALLTNPASRHVESGLSLASEGVHLFVEKPLSHNLDQVDLLIELCRRSDLVLMVGYGFRFYSPLQRLREIARDGRIGEPLYLRAEVGQYLPDWRPGTDYRQGVSARSETGGGAVLELSHELDCAYWLMGGVTAVSAMTERLSNLELDVEDTAEITLKFTSGALGSVHLNMVQRGPARSCRIIGSEGEVRWDMADHRVRVFSEGRWGESDPDPEFDFNQVYTAELEHFLACVVGDACPPADGSAGRRVVELAMAIKASAREGREVKL